MTDPLHANATATDRELFQRVAALLNGVPASSVATIACNILVNAIRQSVPLRKDAEALVNELFARAKSVLLDEHYDSVTGKRRSVFPFTQVVHAPFHDNSKNRFGNGG
jgi:hypothetical protein